MVNEIPVMFVCKDSLLYTVPVGEFCVDIRL